MTKFGTMWVVVNTMNLSICTNVRVPLFSGHIDAGPFFRDLVRYRRHGRLMLRISWRIAHEVPRASATSTPTRGECGRYGVRRQFDLRGSPFFPEFRAFQGFVRSLDVLRVRVNCWGVNDQRFRKGVGDALEEIGGGVDGMAVVGDGMEVFFPRESFSGDADQLAVDCELELELDGIDERFRARFSKVVVTELEADEDRIHAYADEIHQQELHHSPARAFVEYGR